MCYISHLFDIVYHWNQLFKIECSLANPKIAFHMLSQRIIHTTRHKIQPFPPLSHG